MAPTILYLLGLPIPSDMDGKVLVDAFKRSYLLSNPIRYEKAKAPFVPMDFKMTREEEQIVKERLRRLGYIG